MSATRPSSSNTRFCSMENSLSEQPASHRMTGLHRAWSLRRMHGPQGHPRSHLILRRLHSEHDSARPFGGSVWEEGGTGVGLRLLAGCSRDSWAGALMLPPELPLRLMGGPMDRCAEPMVEDMAVGRKRSGAAGYLGPPIELALSLSLPLSCSDKLRARGGSGVWREAIPRSV